MESHIVFNVQGKGHGAQ